VGAHIGAFLVPIARQCRSVVGVEANPATFRLLELNVIVNRLSNVELFNLAAVDGEAAVRFVANKVNTGGSKVLAERVDRPEFYFDDPDVVEVRGARLDDVLGGRSFDLIVIDVEGSEYRALKGMPETLARAGQVAIEFAPNLIDNVAGITIEQFLAAVPERLTSATLLGEETSYDRRELSVVL
jgi:FkbM family methyltransferase